MEQSVVVSRSHIVRQGTFDTDSSKTLRSKSGAIKKGSISLPVIDDKSIGISQVEYKGESVELVKKRKKTSEKSNVKTRDPHQGEYKREINSPRGTIGKSKVREQTKHENEHQSVDDNITHTENREKQLKTSSKKSLKQSNSVTAEVSDTAEREKYKKPQNKNVQNNDKSSDIERSSVVSKPNSKVKEPVENHSTGEQNGQSPHFKRDSAIPDKSRTSRNIVSLDKNNPVENGDSKRKSKSDKRSNTSPQTEETNIRIIGHIEAQKDSRSSESKKGLTTASPKEVVQNDRSPVKSEKGDTKDPLKGSKNQSKDFTKSPVEGTKYIDSNSHESADIKVNYRENKTGLQESEDSFSKRQNVKPTKKRFTKASDVVEDTAVTHARIGESPQPNTDKNQTNNLDPSVALGGVVNKPPQSTSLETRRGDTTKEGLLNQSHINRKI
ncbi:uncharacterized protein LOC132543995 [Ylistrum balloti]|uniref:uncharacterized protein LOC132543995 n=1 Tax=Ylistrum balloti TaxID=509963 RepID=UPI0029059E42|nr:uncharacterized protein LOC132543995 [Ylistrum balloti]